MGHLKKKYSKNTVAYWLRSMITEAYVTASDGLSLTVKVKAQNAVQEELCSPASFDCWNVDFPNHVYLMDVTYWSKDTVVAAQ